MREPPQSAGGSRGIEGGIMRRWFLSGYLEFVLLGLCFLLPGSASAWWESLYPLPPGISINGISGTDSGDVWMVGQGGTIVHFNGSKWQRVSCPVSVTLRDILCVAKDDIWAVGDETTILHWNGSEWKKSEVECKCDLKSVWADGQDYLFAVGVDDDSGVVLRWNGRKWECNHSGLSILYGIGGRAPDNIFAVGADGAVRHYDAAADQWIWCKPITSLPLYSVAATGANEVMAVGGALLDAVIIHWDGTAWSKMDTESAPGLHAIWTAAQDDVFAVGSEGAILHWDGNGWSRMETNETRTFNAVWGSDSENIFAATTTIYNGSSRLWQWDGSGWSDVFPGTQDSIRAIWASSANDVWAVSGSEYLEDFHVFHRDGFTWRIMKTGVADSIRDVWGASSDAVFLVGNNGVILKYDGREFKRIESMSDATFVSVWGTDANDVYIAGNMYDSDKSILFHYDGTDLQEMQRPGNEFFGDIQGLPSGEFFLKGKDTIWHWDTHGWNQLPILPRCNAIYNLWARNTDDLYAVGQGETSYCGYYYVWHWNGKSWNIMLDMYGRYFSGVWGTSSGDLNIVGERGYFYLYRHGYWSEYRVPFCNAFYCTCRVSDQEIFAGGSYGSVYQFDGVLDLAVQIDLNSQTNSGDLFSVTGYIDNSRELLKNTPVFFVLEIEGAFWFWPGWVPYHSSGSGEIDYEIMDIDTGITEIPVINPFQIPELSEPIQGVFRGAILSHSMTEIIGDPVSRSFTMGETPDPLN